jgi:hypothetical protein
MVYPEVRQFHVDISKIAGPTPGKMIVEVYGTFDNPSDTGNIVTVNRVRQTRADVRVDQCVVPCEVYLGINKG